MMFSREKCAGSGSEVQQSSEMHSDAAQEVVDTEEVASAVAAVSDEIGDILKDELGDADKADRIGAELADLSAELGLLAGLAEGEVQADYPSLFEIAMGHRESASGSSSSSSWSGGRSGRARRAPRQLRAPRRRPIAKGKELCRRLGRRAAEARHQPEPPSDASDVGADTDSDDQWTELDDPCSSDSSSVKEEVVVAPADCNGCHEKLMLQKAEPPPMGQFLLPLLTAEAEAAVQPEFLVRHEDILQFLTSTECSVRAGLPAAAPAPDGATSMGLGMYEGEEPAPISLEEEAAVVRYACERSWALAAGAGAAGAGAEGAAWGAAGAWLLGMYHWWCELGALVYTMIGTTMNVDMGTEDWLYRARFACHCRLCLNLVVAPLQDFLRDLIGALAHGQRTMLDAVVLMRCLKLQDPSAELQPRLWDLPPVLPISEEGSSIIHSQLVRFSQSHEIAQQVVDKVCDCHPQPDPLDAQNAVTRFSQILDTFKSASTCTFKVEILAGPPRAPAPCAAATRRLASYLAPYQRVTARDRLREIAARAADHVLGSSFARQCDCASPRILCAAQRKALLRFSVFGTLPSTENDNVQSDAPPHEKVPTDKEMEGSSRELQQGDGTGAKPPDTPEDSPDDTPDEDEPMPQVDAKDSNSDSSHTQDLCDDSDDNSSGSLGLSTSSSLDSASELLLAAAAAVESGESESESAPGELCRTVRHLMRSIASIERLMDRVLRHCDEWPAPRADDHDHARKKVDLGLSEVDRKLMAMYRRLPEVHRKQLQVYRKQKKLSTVCMQLVGGSAPAPPPPGSPPPASPPPAAAEPRALCPEYHLQRFKEVRRKVMHMRDQQLYYHRLRMWLEDQLRQERQRCLPEGTNVTLIDDLTRRKRRTGSPKVSRASSSTKRKSRSHGPSLTKPHKLLQMLKNRSPHGTPESSRSETREEEPKTDVEAPQAFPYPEHPQEPVSDADTIVVEKENGELCKEMKEFLARFAKVALNDANEDQEKQEDVPMQSDTRPVYPESISPPLQELSPTTVAPIPVYTPKPSQRQLAVDKILRRTAIDNLTRDYNPNFSPNPVREVLDIGHARNARRVPILVDSIREDSKCLGKVLNIEKSLPNSVCDGKDGIANTQKYITFGLEIMKAMEECRSIINSYNIKDVKEPVDVVEVHEEAQKTVEDIKDDKVPSEADGALSLEQICEVMMNLDKNSAEFLEKIDNDGAEEQVDVNMTNTKLAELVENMPQILANMPEIASKLSEFANASFELPEFASIMSNLPEVNNEAQLTPETLKQIRELKLNKCRDNVKVTKNTAKRKTTRKVRSTVENDVIGTMTFEIDSQDISEVMKDEKEVEAIIRSKTSNKEEFKDLLFSISAQVVINKVFEHLKQNKIPELAKCFEDDIELFSTDKNSFTSEMFTKASTLFDNSVKDALSMHDLRQIVKCRFTAWKHYIAREFKTIPRDMLEKEIEDMLDKFYTYIHDLATKQTEEAKDKVVHKIEELKNKSQAEDAKLDNDKQDTEDKGDLKDKFKINLTCTNPLDLVIMRTSRMSKDKRCSMKKMKFEYMDVVKSCCDSPELVNWILLDPEIAASVILDMTGITTKKREPAPNFTNMPKDKKIDYFINRLRDMNRMYMLTLPKSSITVDEWLIMLYKLELLENYLKDCLIKAATPTTKPAQTQTQTQNQSHVSETREAEILAGKGLSKLISKANSKPVKKAEPPKPKPEEKKEPIVETVKTENATKEPPKPPEADRKDKNDALLAKCEAILTSKGEKSLLDSFYKIKSYITQGQPVPESYKKHVISICSSIDAKLLDEDIHETLSKGRTIDDPRPVPKPQEKPEKLDKTKLKIPKCCQRHQDEADGTRPPTLSTQKNHPISVIGAQNPELLAKYSAQALRNAKQTLNAVAFRNMMRNGQSKSESDACDTPKSDCKWTNDCICTSCKNSETGSVCLGDIVKQCYDIEAKQSKASLEDGKVKEAKPVPAPKPPAKPQPKPQTKCENAQHQQHVCKVGHSGGPCAIEGGHQNSATGQEQPCTCCYCTVFGQAPQNTTPVSRNYNETRERLLTILNRKKLKTAASNPPEQDPQEKKPPAQAQEAPQPPAQPVQKQKPPQNVTKQIPPRPQPPNPVAPQVQVKKQEVEDNQQKYLTEKMSKMVVTDGQEVQKIAKEPQKVKTTQRVPVPQTPPPVAKVEPKAKERSVEPQIVQQPQKVQPPPLAPEPKARPQPTDPQPQPRQSRPQQKQAASLSSRETSVFSSSSCCSVLSNWRSGGSDVSRVEDTRDLDALLQYIEGPARHVDREKKRAKKQRQKAKKMERRLYVEYVAVCKAWAMWKQSAEQMRASQAAAAGQVRDARAALERFTRADRKRGKKKVNSARHATMQLVEEQLSELTKLMNKTTEELKEADANLAKYTNRRIDVEIELLKVRDILYGHEISGDRGKKLIRNLEMLKQSLADKQRRIDDKDEQIEFIAELTPMPAPPIIEEAGGGVVRVRRAADGAAHAQPADGGHWDARAGADMNVSSDLTSPKPPHAEPKKQTWEAALAHMNQLAKANAAREKQKKPKEEKPEVKKEAQRPPPAAEPEPAEPPPLSKKQRKLIAKQKAEEEEAKQRQIEALRAARKERKEKRLAEAAPKPPAEPIKKDVRKPTEPPKKTEPPKRTPREEVKKEIKKQEKVIEKKGKENRQERTVPVPPSEVKKQPKPSQAPPPQTNAQGPPKPRKKETKPQVINITADTTIEVVSKTGKCSKEVEKPASCSIMEQLSCGIQVADLKLPPGITLTRVQPSEKKEPAPIKSVPAWKGAALAAPPTPLARAPPVINADPSLMMFTTHHPEAPKTIIISEPQPAPPPKSKKAKKRAKKAAADAHAHKNQDGGAKMVTLRNPMFHPNLPPVQVAAPKAPDIRIPDPIPMPPNPCQATITPTSNGMYTIRNPLMSMMHQQSLVRPQTPQAFAPPTPQFGPGYSNPNAYPPPPEPPAETNHAHIMNLASFTQKSEDGYSLFNTTEEKKEFFRPESYYTEPAPPHPIGTRPGVPPPIGTPPRPEPRAPYTPFGQHRFRSAVFDEREEPANGDSLPYFQRLRVGARLNNEVTIHHVSDSKFFKGQDQQPVEITVQPKSDQDSVFTRPYPAKSWTPGYVTPSPSNSTSSVSSNQFHKGSANSSVYDSVSNSSSNSPQAHIDGVRDEENGFGAIGSRNGIKPQHFYSESNSVFAPDRSITNLNELDSSERDIESFKRFDFYFEPPKNKPKINFNVHDIAAQLRPKDNK